MDNVHISALYVYPVKACQGVKLASCAALFSGLEYDRTFCIVDMEGTRYPQRQSLSQRQLPKLASISVAFSLEERAIMLSAPGCAPVSVPLDASTYESADDITIECGSASTTSAGSWQLGTMAGKVCNAKVNAWLSDYLNDVDAAKRKKPRAQFALVKAIGERFLARYAGPTQAPFSNDIKKQRTFEASPFKMQRVPIIPEDACQFADFGPFLLTSAASLSDLSREIGDEHPMSAFRPNIVVAGEGLAPWEEDTWKSLNIGEEASFRVLKSCPRCTVPARNQKSGDWQYPTKGEKLKVQKALRKMFPEKTVDDEWGAEWQGPMFGVHVAVDFEARISVGDKVQIVEHAADERSSLWFMLKYIVPLMLAVLITVVYKYILL